MRQDAADPKNTDPTAKFMAPIFVCLLETMIRHHNESAAGSPAKSAPSAPVGGGGELPVDCVRLGDRPGTFKNICDFPVYYVYCGMNPHPGSWTAVCDDPKNTMGLDGIGANSYQGAFTRAERMYWLACKKPLVPKDVKFIPGQGLYGTCRMF